MLVCFKFIQILPRLYRAIDIGSSLACTILDQLREILTDNYSMKFVNLLFSGELFGIH